MAALELTGSRLRAVGFVREDSAPRSYGLQHMRNLPIGGRCSRSLPFLASCGAISTPHTIVTGLLIIISEDKKALITDR